VGDRVSLMGGGIWGMGVWGMGERKSVGKRLVGDRKVGYSIDSCSVHDARELVEVLA
jgi:hypothetical protein